MYELFFIPSPVLTTHSSDTCVFKDYLSHLLFFISSVCAHVCGCESTCEARGQPQLLGLFLTSHLLLIYLIIYYLFEAGLSLVCSLLVSLPVSVCTSPALGPQACLLMWALWIEMQSFALTWQTLG